uniref:Reverse transcriptase zinc-binding domain-containing protein n=1 Tax=Arundo donax TaxID=35708 RepID=A0A0A9E2U6_ARUDO
MRTAYQAFFISQLKVAGVRKSRVPNKCRFVIWLVIHGRFWTSDWLQRHGLRNNGPCALCSQHPETLDHLILGCVYSRETWFNLLHWARLQCVTPNPDAPFVEWWLQSRKEVPKPRRESFDTMVILGAWRIWNERNGRVFRGASLPPMSLVGSIANEARLWDRVGIFVWSEFFCE